jgi:hypothetical protein
LREDGFGRVSGLLEAVSFMRMVVDEAGRHHVHVVYILGIFLIFGPVLTRVVRPRFAHEMSYLRPSS